MLAFYLGKKCEKAIKENIAYWTNLRNNPSSIINFKASGAIVDALTSANFWSYMADYIAQNSDALLVEAFKATGGESTLEDALKLCNNMLASAVMAENNLILRMMQGIAWRLIKDLSVKDKQLINIVNRVKELYMHLALVAGAVPEWETYYTELRQALRLINSAQNDFTTVYNTYEKKSVWLTRLFNGTVTKLENAKKLIDPPNKNPAMHKINEGTYKANQQLASKDPGKEPRPGQSKAIYARNLVLLADAKAKAFNKAGNQALGLLGQGLTDNFPFASTKDVYQSMQAIAKISNLLMVDCESYWNVTTRINLEIDAFYTGLEDLKGGMVNIMKTYVLNLLSANMRRLRILSDSMAVTLNGDKTATLGPIPSTSSPTGKYNPNSLIVTTMSFKWMMDINLILQAYKLLPLKQMDIMNLDQVCVDYYKKTCATLKAMGPMKSTLASLPLNQAKEEVGDLEQQILTLIAEANGAAAGAGAFRRGILSLCKTVLARLELSLKADNKIYIQVSGFYNFIENNLPDITSLDNTYGACQSLYHRANLDRAVACLQNGDFKTLLGLKGNTAAYVGAALAAAALLKKCLGKRFDFDIWLLDLKSDLDLLNIEFSINFNLEIIKNLLVCFNIKAALGKIDPYEILCAIARDFAASGFDMSKTSQKIKDIFSDKETLNFTVGG